MIVNDAKYVFERDIVVGQDEHSNVIAKTMLRKSSCAEM